jgi:hypothetical protein
MIKPNSLLHLFHAVEAAGYATAGSCESSEEWHAAAVARWRASHAWRFIPDLSSTLVSVLLAALLVIV